MWYLKNLVSQVAFKVNAAQCPSLHCFGSFMNCIFYKTFIRHHTNVTTSLDAGLCFLEVTCTGLWYFWFEKKKRDGNIAVSGKICVPFLSNTIKFISENSPKQTTTYVKLKKGYYEAKSTKSLPPEKTTGSKEWRLNILKINSWVITSPKKLNNEN